MADNKQSVSHEGRIDYYPGRVPYYPKRVVTAEIVSGYAKKNDISMSRAVDELINATVKNMTQEDRDSLLFFARKKE